MKIAILAREDYKSPRVLAESLRDQVVKIGGRADIIYGMGTLSRLVSWKGSGLRFHFWVRRRISHFFSDRRLLWRLKQYDAVVVCECAPDIFYKNVYNVESFKKMLGIPVLLYEVYYIGNAPTQVKHLNEGGHPTVERFDFHLAISDVTELRGIPDSHWGFIGLDLTNSGLRPEPKEDFIALLDFTHPGNENYHDEQLQACRELNINTIVLKDKLTINEIRACYRKASVYLMQSSEAFGLPIAENLACGSQVFTPDAAWPMSWRMEENPAVHAPGNLATCFTVYHGMEDLLSKLGEYKEKYTAETSLNVFNEFKDHYPHFYRGNQEALKRGLRFIGIS